MGSYKLSKEAEADLIRIHQHGMRNYGEQKTDQYFHAFCERFEELAENPDFFYPVVDNVREGYRRSVCGVDSNYYRVEGTEAEIMAIIGRQDTVEWL